MKRLDYFKIALKEKLYEKMDWIISAFCLVREPTKQNYPFKIIANATGYYFIDPSNNMELTKIEDAVLGKPLFIFKEKCLVGPTECNNLNSEVEEYIGNVLANLIILVNSFGNKIPFITGSKFKISSIEDIIAKKLTTNTTDKRDDKLIYVDEYEKFVKSISYMEELSTIAVWGASEKTMTAPTGIKEFKAKLIKENEGKLHDASVIAKIEEQLVAYDAAYLKGDPAGETSAGSKKMRTVVRKKLYLMMGGGETIINTATVDPIMNSLEEGWEVDKFPQMNNTLRYGAYARGHQTQLGGVIVKMILRASANIKLVQEDCGTKLGLKRLVTEDSYKKLIGIYVIENNKTVLIDNEEMAKAYINKVVTKRSPLYCKTPKTDFCSFCLGTKLSNSPNGISLAMSDYGSGFLNLFLKKMHTGALALAKMDLNKSIT